MTPKQYLDRYTYLRFWSPWNMEQMLAGITEYGSGWDYRNGTEGAGKAMQQEFQAFNRALRIAHHGDAHTPCGEKFFFNEKPLFCLIAPTEDFYISSFINAFLGKGSPDEIIDTLRIAVAIGRIGMDKDAAGQHPGRPTAQAYAKAFITLDCNGLVGNYYGGDPSASIEHYAHASRARKSAGEIQVGDAVVTHCAKFPFEHVGLIQECTPGGNGASIRIVEWGWKGGEEVHYSVTPKTYQIKQGPEKRFGVGWEASSHHQELGNDQKKHAVPSFRYVFAPPGRGDPRGW
jgi:hypothetical protein